MSGLAISHCVIVVSVAKTTIESELDTLLVCFVESVLRLWSTVGGIEDLFTKIVRLLFVWIIGKSDKCIETVLHNRQLNIKSTVRLNRKALECLRLNFISN